jgi:hypothetical protein
MWEAALRALSIKHHASKQLYCAGTEKKGTGKKESGCLGETAIELVSRSECVVDYSGTEQQGIVQMNWTAGKAGRY